MGTSFLQGLVRRVVQKNTFIKKNPYVDQPILPYSLKFSRIKYFKVLPNSAQKQIFTDKILWSSFQPRLASVMNLKFCWRNFSRPFSDPRNLRKFSTSKILGYMVLLKAVAADKHRACASNALMKMCTHVQSHELYSL